jgi:hypothetical protein
LRKREETPRKNVLRNRQRRGNSDLLEDKAYAAPRRLRYGSRRVRLAIKNHPALIRALGAGEYLEKRRLAGAILADKGVNLAWLERNGDVRQRARVAKETL